jgi:hypothetical protein
MDIEKMQPAKVLIVVVTLSAVAMVLGLLCVQQFRPG